MKTYTVWEWPGTEHLEEHFKNSDQPVRRWYITEYGSDNIKYTVWPDTISGEYIDKGCNYDWSPPPMSECDLVEELTEEDLFLRLM